MTTKEQIVPERTVAIYIHSRGFSYAVMDSPLELIETRLWEIPSHEIERINQAIRMVIQKHQPSTLIVENCNSQYCRKGKRAKNLIQSLILWAKKHSIPYYAYSRNDIRNVFEPWKAKNRHEISEVLVRNIEQLKPYAYEKPSYPNKERNIASIFVAVSLAVTHYFLKG